jgi:hypothetical protein
VLELSATVVVTGFTVDPSIVLESTGFVVEVTTVVTSVVPTTFVLVVPLLSDVVWASAVLVSTEFVGVSTAAVVLNGFEVSVSKVVLLSTGFVVVFKSTPDVVALDWS